MKAPLEHTRQSLLYFYPCSSRNLYTYEDITFSRRLVGLRPLGMAAASSALRRRFSGWEGASDVVAGGGACCEEEEAFWRFPAPPLRRRLRPPAVDSCWGSIEEGRPEAAAVVGAAA
jgi:hypothetical protein